MYAVKAASSAPHHPSQPQMHRVSGRNDEDRIGEPVRYLVVEAPDRRFLSALDRDHAVEHVAGQSQLDAHGTSDQVPRPGSEQQRAGADRGNHDAQHGNLVG